MHRQEAEASALEQKAEIAVARLQESEELVSTMDHCLTARIDALTEQSEIAAAAAGRNREDLDRLAAQQSGAASALVQRMHGSAEIVSNLEQKLADLEEMIRQTTVSSALSAELRRQQDIIKLCTKGLSPREIADALEMHIGEVQLILSLKLEPPRGADSAGARAVIPCKASCQTNKQVRTGTS
jgi:DNA-binding NarL/FixJ family response regulator